MKKVIAIIASEAGCKLEVLKYRDNPVMASELMELLTLHEQLTGNLPPFINEACVSQIAHRHLGLDDECSGEASPNVNGTHHGNHPPFTQNAPAA